MYSLHVSETRRIAAIIYIRLSSYNENSKELKIYYQSATIQTFNTYTVDIDENLTISPGEVINFNIALAKSDPIYQNFPVNFKFNSLDTVKYKFFRAWKICKNRLYRS